MLAKKQSLAGEPASKACSVQVVGCTVLRFTHSPLGSPIREQYYIPVCRKINQRLSLIRRATTASLGHLLFCYQKEKMEAGKSKRTGMKNLSKLAEKSESELLMNLTILQGASARVLGDMEAASR